MHLSRAQAQENCSHLNKHLQLLPAVPVPQQRIHVAGPSPQPGQARRTCLSLGVFSGDVLLLILPPASLQVKEWGQCRHPEHCPFLCSPVAQGRVLWQGCTSQRMGGWQEGWIENSVTHTSFASWMHLQQFILLVSYWSDQCLSVCPLLKDRASSTPQSSQF